MNYFAIGDEDAVLGFGLAGVRGRAAKNADEALGAFREAVADRKVGVVLITERAADLIRPQVDSWLASESFPLVVEVPDRGGRLPGRPGLRELASSALGVGA
ncbi:MAG: V-type ATP synthase subunit F [Spirochaetales bacterium]|nr:V-type ATP synthase subunit F [Spirochaetales bacterium]